MSDNIETLVTYALDKKPVEFAATFDTLIRQRAIDALESKKVEIADSIYNGATPTADTSDDDVTDDDNFDDDFGDFDDDDLEFDDIDFDVDLDDLNNDSEGPSYDEND